MELFIPNLFLILIILNILWWVWLIVPVFRYHDPVFRRDVDSPCSILIVFRNEAKNLKKLLPKLEDQNFLGAVQLVFVNDRSSDESVEVLENHEFSKKFEISIISITTDPEIFSSKKFALQKGIQICKYESLILMDGDCYPLSNRWIQNGKNALQENEIYLGLGLYKQESTIINDLVQYDTFLTALQYSGWTVKGFPYMSLGRNWGYRKSLFLEKGGFEGLERTLGGDDDLLFQKLSQRQSVALLLGKESRTISEPKRSLKEFFIQKIRHLGSGNSYGSFQKLIAGFAVTNHFFLFAWIGLLLGGAQYLFMTTSLLILRYALLYFGAITGRKKFGIHQNLFVLPLTEVLYLISHLFAFFASLFVRNPAWKKEENSQVRH